MLPKGLHCLIEGTSSTREALSLLLNGKCYHMSSVFMGTEKDWDFWERVLEDLDRDEKQITDQV
jgi:Sulfotransferase domain